MATNPFRVTPAITYLIPGSPKLNPGLELANTFGVLANTFGVLANTFGVLANTSVYWLRPACKGQLIARGCGSAACAI